MNETCKVLVVDDDEGFREVLRRQLSRLGYACATADGGAAALEALKTNDFDVALIDLVMPDMDGMALLAAMGEADLDTVPVVLSGRGTISTAVEAMKRGAFDYVEKESDVEALRSMVEKAAGQRRLRRQARQMSEAVKQWEATFDAVPDLIAIVDDQFRFVRVNKAMADRLGCAPEEAAGQTCYEQVHGSAQPPPFCPHVKSLEDDRVKITEGYEKRMGGHLLLSTSPLHDAEGRLIGCVHVARDVTEQKRTEKELRRAHGETEKLLASMSSFLIEVDGDLRVARWNSAAETTFGITAAEVIGTRFTDTRIQWDWSAVSANLPDWQGAEQPIRLSVMRFTRPDGREGVLGITVNPIKSDHAKPSGFFLLGADITERKMLEAQLVQAQKLESIGQLAAGIAHEVNTPTQYVGDNIEFLQYAFEDLEKLRLAYDRLLELAKEGALEDALVSEIAAAVEEINVEYLVKQIPRAIRQSLEGVERIASIVKAMKEFSHPGTEEKTRIDLNRSIDSTITVSRNEWKYVADVETDFDPNLPLVACFPGEFNQVVLNILVNAAHAIADAVGDGSSGKGTITVNTRRDGDWAEVRISDTGPGIPEKARTRIFDPFYTTKEVGRGTGQGLAMARNVIVDKHGGTLTFETEMGKGTTFVIRLPISGE